ncbi:MAG: 2-oxoglutarate dehydrogenase, E2 component, dihydrolipoamide succinyltransferase, partial [Actinomyces sp.]|nr:2-oxoglutarate dehydrogenase, E2 component, dihydrolipoamide succinyltransferase [Actinomyces sp.]
MSVDIKMPALGESVTEGTVTTWLKAVGDTVEQDEPSLEVSTDKVDSEVPAPASGVLQKILVEEDDTVDVGTVLGTIGDSAESEPEPAAPAPEEASAPAPSP